MKANVKQRLADAEFEKKCTEQFSKMWATGCGYGAKCFAQVVKDMLDAGGDDMMEKITRFVDTTLKNSPQELTKAFANIQQRTQKITDDMKHIGKDEANE